MLLQLSFTKPTMSETPIPPQVPILPPKTPTVQSTPQSPVTETIPPPSRSPQHLGNRTSPKRRKWDQSSIMTAPTPCCYRCGNPINYKINIGNWLDVLPDKRPSDHEGPANLSMACIKRALS